MSSSATTRTPQVQRGPVTELALLRLKSSSSFDSSHGISETILQKLAHATQAQVEFSSYPVTLLHCQEDTSLIFLVGGWSSAAQHMNDWIPKEKNQELMTLLGSDIDVEWMFHLAADPVEVHKTLSRDRIVGIGRHFIKSGQDEDFERCFEENKSVLESFVGSKDGVCGGWRLDHAFEKNQDDLTEAGEFVLFSSWPTIQRHGEFSEAEGFKKRYAKIRDFVARFEIKHGSGLILPPK